MSDQLANGRQFRVLNIIDDFNRECVGQLVDSLISGARITRYMDALDRPPEVLVCNYGPEFTSKALFFWTRANQVRLHLIQPGKPTQNAFIESFSGTLATSA